MRIKLGRPIPTEELRRRFPKDIAVYQNDIAYYLTTDSREVRPGDIFAALPGKNTSGQAYIVSARTLGASAAITGSSLSILSALAESYRNSLAPIVIAVTGSVGKTSTKEFLRSLFSVRYRVSATQENYNNELGVPLTLLSMPENTQVLIAELGMRALGEISYLARLVQPETALITAIGQSHLETLGNLYNIRKAKFEITDGLKEIGTLYLGCGVFPLSEDPILRKKYRTVSLSTSPEMPPAVYAVSCRENETYFSLSAGGRNYEALQIPVLGAHMAKNAALAVLVALQYGLTEEEIRAGLAGFQNASRRSDIRTVKGITLIEDCYNASPESMAAAAELLKNVKGMHPGSRAFALLGDMLELGRDSRALHIAVGQIFGRLPLSGLFVYGDRANDILEGARMTGFSGMMSNIPYKLKDILVPGDILLVKASREMEAEKLAGEILGGRTEI